MIVFFGDPWTPPSVYQGLREKEHRQAAAPLGLTCIGCAVAIVSGDQGYYMPVMRPGGPFGDDYYSFDPVHRECDLANRVGPLEHLGDTCGCRGGLFTHNPRQPLEKRATAMEAWRRYA